MNKHILITVVLFIFFTVKCESVPIKDTISVPKNSLIINNIFQYTDFTAVEIIKPEVHIFRDYVPIFNGYLIIQLDSNTQKVKAFPGWYLFTTVYWVKSLESIETDSLKYYYNYPTSLILDGKENYIRGERDGLSTFLYCYYLFNEQNDRFSGGYLHNCPTTYLFNKRDWLNTDLLINQTIWKKKNTEVEYIIYEASFACEFLFFKDQKKKSLIPTSYTDTLSFSPFNKDDGLFYEDMSNLGFYKSDKTVKLF